MAWQVLITDSALADLREIVGFIAEDDPLAAERMGNRLVARVLELETMPDRHALHDPGRGIRKFPVLPYLIFYHCDHEDRIVNVLHFWHGSRQWPTFE